MKIYKHTTNSLTYYQCEPLPTIHLFAFTKRALLRDLLAVYRIVLLKPFNLN